MYFLLVNIQFEGTLTFKAEKEEDLQEQWDYFKKDIYDEVNWMQKIEGELKEEWKKTG